MLEIEKVNGAVEEKKGGMKICALICVNSVLINFRLQLIPSPPKEIFCVKTRFKDVLNKFSD